MALSEQILQACKELIDDAKMSCADLVFKEISLEILAKASNVLTKRQFKLLVAYTAERMREKIPFQIEHELVLKR
jgi:hypothetical protein